MKVKEEADNTNKHTANILVIIVSFLFLVSIAMSVIGLLSAEKDDITSNERTSEEFYNIEKAEDEESLGEMFQKEFLESSKSEARYDYNDPFREICSVTEDDGIPAISSYTVCY